MKERILIVDDEQDIVYMLKDCLEIEGYEVLYAFDGKSALNTINDSLDLIILDVMLPDIEGFDLCKAIRDSVNCPILFLSARGSENDMVHGLALGADDYIVKPFSIKEFRARVEAHLRRQKRNTSAERKMISFGKLLIDLRAMIIYFENKPIKLTSKEYEIVQFLALNRGQVFSKEQIYEKIWGYDSEGDSNIVTEYIKRIRSRFSEKGIDFNVISTVWGVGYRWEKNIPK